MVLLTELYKMIEKEIYLIMGDKINELQEVLKKTLAGDIISKKLLMNKIKELIPEFIEEKDYKELIGQYHINYFEPIYTGNLEQIDNIINHNILTKDATSSELLDKLTQIVFQELYGLSVIDEYSYGDIKGINEINCNAYDYITLQVYGKEIKLPRLFFKDNDVFKKIVKKSISFDAKSDLKPDCPEVLCQRITGARVTALMPPYSKEYSLNIRYFDVEMISSRQFIEKGTSTEEIEKFIDTIVLGRPNIVVIGDQGTGKTTYILRIIGSIPDHIKIATIEPMFELNPDMYYPTKNIKKLQFLPGLKTPEHAFETCLRLGRDIIINGEIRSPDEAVVQLKAWTRQGRGSLGSFHTSSTYDYMFDFKNLLMQKGYYFSEKAALYDISRATDLIIHLDIDRKTGHRYIREIAEVIVNDSVYKANDTNNDTGSLFSINTIFKYNKKTGKTEKVNKISDQLINRCLEYEFDEKNIETLKELDLY